MDVPATARNIAEAFTARARLTPEAPAVIDDGRVVSYGVLEAAISRAARRFSGLGWGRGAVVGIALARAPAALHLAAALALARIGAIQLLLSPHEAASGEAGALLRRHRAAGTVTDMPVAGGDGIPSSRVERRWLDPAAPDPGPVPPAVGADLPWLVARSSGTTGDPKAFAVTHDMELARQRAKPETLVLAPGERAMTMVGLGFTMGLRWALWFLWDGGVLVALPRSGRPDAMLDAIDRHRVSYLVGTPSHLPVLLKGAGDGDGPRLPGLRTLGVGSAALAPSLVREVTRRLSPNLHNFYGANEAWSIAVATPDMLRRHPDTAGRVSPGVALEIIDRNGRPVAPGVTGEVRMRSPGMIDGYIDDPQATAQHFRDGWFHPGDAAAMTGDGLLFLKGRTDEMMNFGGILVSPAEIERVVLMHPGIAEAAAFGVPSRSHGDIPLVAVTAAAAIDAEALLAHCRGRLGRRAPVKVIQVDVLPRNAIGKVLRRRLAEIVREEIGGARPPARSPGDVTSDSEPPRRGGP